jgi:hypothetical protein
MVLRDLYGNTSKTGFSIDFFSLAAPGAQSAVLASPFFTLVEPVNLLTERGCTVKLLVRLCSATFPEALKAVHKNPLVSVRYYTDRLFHAKLYVVDDVAMVGSANLTAAGLKLNSEVSVVLHKGRDPAFEALPSIFARLWEFADVLTDPILSAYETAWKAPGSPADEDGFDKFLSGFIPPVSPPTVIDGTGQQTFERSFLQRFRRKYDEVLIPAHRSLMRIAATSDFGRPEFEGADPEIEMGRFLGWVRLTHGAGDKWRQSPVRSGVQQEAHIREHMTLWRHAGNIVAGDMFNAAGEIGKIARIRQNFRSSSLIEKMSYDDIFDTLTGCHAFLELLRFTNGALEGLRADFIARNKLSDIKRTIDYLANGKGDPVQRAYDCIHDDRYRLNRFAEGCVMELAGWISTDRPPFNGRTIKGLRYLGFDVEKYAE